MSDIEGYELHQYIREKNYAMAKRWLYARPLNFNKPDHTGNTPLNHACQHNFLDGVKLLLTNPNININVQNTGGYTGLHDACINGFCDIALFLLNKGAKYDICAINKESPLHGATSRGHHKAVELLILFGADKKAKNSDGKTPSDIAFNKRLRIEKINGEYVIINEIDPEMIKLFSNNYEDMESFCVL